MDTVVVKNLTKKFGTTTALDDLSLTIPMGKMTGIIGADASGKTTLLRIIIGLLKADTGTVVTLGLDPASQKRTLTAKIGYMPQKFGLYEDLTVRENLEFYADLKAVDKEFSTLLDFTGLQPFQDRLAGKLSGGMKQKLGLACALLGDPEFLVLDEPSVGVDPISRRDLMHLVRTTITPATTVVWSTAYLDEANSFDNTIVMDKGKVIYHGSPEKLASTPAEFEREVIRLMGGYEEKASQIAAHYIYKETDHRRKRRRQIYLLQNDVRPCPAYWRHRQDHGRRHQKKSDSGQVLPGLYGSKIFLIRQYVCLRKPEIFRWYLWHPSPRHQNTGG